MTSRTKPRIYSLPRKRDTLYSKTSFLGAGLDNTSVYFAPPKYIISKAPHLNVRWDESGFMGRGLHAVTSAQNSGRLLPTPYGSNVSSSCESLITFSPPNSPLIYMVGMKSSAVYFSSI